MVKLKDIEKEIKGRIDGALNSLTVNINREITIEGPVSGESHVLSLSEMLNDCKRARAIRRIVEFERSSQLVKKKVA